MILFSEIGVESLNLQQLSVVDCFHIGRLATIIAFNVNQSKKLERHFSFLVNGQVHKKVVSFLLKSFPGQGVGRMEWIECSSMR